MTHEFQVTSFDTVGRRFLAQKSTADCEGSTRVPRTDTGTFSYGLAGGKLYLLLSSECQAMRLGGSTELLGTWRVEDLAAELPPELRPASCPYPMPGTRPLDPPARFEITLSPTGMDWSSYDESCLGEELRSQLRTRFRTDSAVTIAEADCRRSAAHLSRPIRGGQEGLLRLRGRQRLRQAMGLGQVGRSPPPARSGPSLPLSPP